MTFDGDRISRLLDNLRQRQKRLVELAYANLESRTYVVSNDLVHFALVRTLGAHIGLLALTHTSPELIDMQSRARWLARWIVMYCATQGYAVEELASENGLEAIEAIAVVAATQKAMIDDLFAHPNLADPTSSWQHVNQRATQFINTLSEQSKEQIT